MRRNPFPTRRSILGLLASGLLIWILLSTASPSCNGGSSDERPSGRAPDGTAAGGPASRAVAAGSDRLDLLLTHEVGRPGAAGEKPLIAHVRIVDLDRDGRNDLLVCDVAAARVLWLQQSESGVFHEKAISDSIGAPVHVEAIDIDDDDDLDLLVAAMGVMLPSNERTGSVIVLENDGKESFDTRLVADRVARVTDVQGGDLDGDGDIDLAVGQFGYDQGEIRWMENLGGWRFESHVLLRLSGTIHVPVADLDRDGDLDIAALVSQEWEEIHVFENDGGGNFTNRLVFGAVTDDYCSSGIALGDLDGDLDPDILYTNGDAFVATDYRPLPNHGVQWLDNRGGMKFDFHRIADFPGAYSPRVVDLDRDGDLDAICVSCFNYWDRPETRSAVWYENAGGGRFIPHGLAVGPTHLVTVDAGDLDGDGRVDLVTGGMALYPPLRGRPRCDPTTPAPGRGSGRCDSRWDSSIGDGRRAGAPSASIRPILWRRFSRPVSRCSTVAGSGSSRSSARSWNAFPGSPRDTGRSPEP